MTTAEPDSESETAEPETTVEETTAAIKDTLPEDTKDYYTGPEVTPDPEDTLPATPVLEGNPYGDGVTPEELRAAYDEFHTQSGYYKDSYTNFSQAYDTPYYYVFRFKCGGKAYSKLTGQMIDLCQDPFCGHVDCIYGYTSDLEQVFVFDDYLYFLVDWVPSGQDQTGTRLIRTDLSFGDPKVMTTFPAGNDTKSMFYYNGKFYYSSRTIIGDFNSHYSLFCYDPATGEQTIQWDDDMAISTFAEVSSDGWMYFTPDKGENVNGITRYHVESKVFETVVSNKLLNAEMGETSFIAIAIYDQKLLIRRFGYNHSMTDLVYDLNTGVMTEQSEIVKLPELPENIYGVRLFANGYYYYSVDHRVEAYKDDPFYAYYHNYIEGVNPSFNCPGGGEIWRTNAETGERELVCRLVTDGIPDHIQGIFAADSKTLVVSYSSYKDFTNMYNMGGRRFSKRNAWRSLTWKRDGSCAPVFAHSPPPNPTEKWPLVSTTDRFVKKVSRIGKI